MDSKLWNILIGIMSHVDALNTLSLEHGSDIFPSRLSFFVSLGLKVGWNKKKERSLNSSI